MQPYYKSLIFIKVKETLQEFNVIPQIAFNQIELHYHAFLSPLNMIIYLFIYCIFFV